MKHILTLLAALLLAPLAAPRAAEPTGFAPPGMWINDVWLAQAGGVYHAFYMQAPRCVGSTKERIPHQQIGHAISGNLRDWTDQGPVVVGLRNTWRDGIATGSVAAHDGRWWMVFTASGHQGGSIGLATSSDLMTWKVDDAPVVRFEKPFVDTWQGKPLRWTGYGDPYLYPEPIDGWRYMLLNSRDVDAPLSISGCLTMMRSRDMRRWEPAGVISYPRWCERQETPQIWSHEGRWYLYFGAAHDHGIPAAYEAVAPKGHEKAIRLNCVFVADRFEGPYIAKGTWCLNLPDRSFGYIYKVFSGPAGRDLLLTTADWRLAGPYAVEYAADGTIADVKVSR